MPSGESAVDSAGLNLRVGGRPHFVRSDGIRTMGKKKANDTLAPGTRIRVRSGVTIPEFPDVDCTGWTGSVAELSGKKADPKYVVEWDESVVAAMPKAYLEACEKSGLYFRMACFTRDKLELETG
jgi:hypothetical protein